MTAADYPDFATPQAHAAQIAATGVPLLSKPAALFAINSLVINGGSSSQTGPVSVTQTGYTAYAGVSFPAAATSPFVEITLGWIDSVTGTLAAEEHYFLAGNTAGVGLVTLGSGLTKGDQCQLTVVNLDPAQTVTVALHINQDSVPRLRERWNWRNFLVSGSTVPTFTLPTLPDDENCLGVIPNLNVPVSSFVTRLCGMAPGRLVTLAGNVSGPPVANVIIQAKATPNASYTQSGWLLYAIPTAAGFSYTFPAPRCPIRVIAQNTSGSTALTFDAALFAQD